MIVDASDPAYAEMKLWVDADADGSTDAGELHGLVEFGVAELRLDAVRGTDTDQGNLLGLVGSWADAEGGSHEMVDVWFAKQPVAAVGDASAPPLGDLLAAPAADLNLPGGPGDAGTPTVIAAAASSGGVATGAGPGALHTLHDDDWRNQLLL